jgi:hypothetical protein
MKFLATATRSIRNAQTGRIKQIIKGEIYTQAFVKPFFTNGATPDFLVDCDLSHFERFVACRPEFFKAQGVESDIYYAVCKAIVAFQLVLRITLQLSSVEQVLSTQLKMQSLHQQSI